MRLTLPTLLLALGAACGLLRDDTPDLPELEDPCAAFTEPGLYRLPVTVDKLTRRPYVYVPKLPEGARPGLIMLHGAGSNALRALSFTDFRARADELGLVVLLPNGSGAVDSYTWNAGTCCGYAEAQQVDDLDFLDAAADTVRDRLCIDGLYGVGHSNGGMMMARWACARDSLDAVVTSAGPLLTSTCASEPRPFMAWHGDADDVVPFEGGEVEEERFPAAKDAFTLVRERNGCTDASPVAETLGDVVCESWDCLVPTRFCRVVGWTHKWPGGTSDRLGNLPIEDLILPWFGLDQPAVDTDLPVDTERDTDG